MAPDGRKVKGTIHWVSAKFGAHAKVNLYDKLFNDEYPESEGDFIENINEESLIVIDDAILEPSLLTSKEYEKFQFVRKGFFSVDPVESKEGAPVFNRVVSLRDSWAKIQNK
jgi:glutaminyl-tRNA synthetase